MIRRLSIFLFGVLLGLMVVRFAFPGRFSEYANYFSLDYRVLYHLNKEVVFISPLAQCKLECLNVDQEEVLDILNDGSVNFSKSQTKTEPCKSYTIEKDNLNVIFELCEEKVTLKDFEFNNQKKCDCTN